MNLPHDSAGKECSCTRCIMAVRAEVERSARAVLLANISAVLSIHHAEKVGESYQRRMRAGLDPLRLAGVLPE